MPTYKYKARDKSGQIAKGKLVGTDARAVRELLREQGYSVLDVSEIREKLSRSWHPFYLFNRYVINPMFGGATVYDLAQFYRRLYNLIKSGVPLFQAMHSITKQGGNRRLRKIAAETLEWIQEGKQLSESFARYPWMFPELHINLLRAGESSGNLEGVLGRLAEYLEWEHKLRQKVRLATLYPKILVLAIIFIPSFPILILQGLIPYLKATLGILLPMLVFLGLVWGVYRLLYQIRSFRYFIDLVKISIPKIGTMVRMIGLAKFYRSFSTMYAAGMPLSKGLYYASGTVGNWYLLTRLRTAIPLVEQGVSITEALRQTYVLPQMAMDMLSTGEYTGNVDEMLDKAGEYTENEAEVAIVQSTVILGVLTFLFAAAFIGLIVAQFYGGYGSGYGDLM